VPLVLLQHCRGVALVNDQDVVEEFPAHGADEAFGDRVARGARAGVRMILTSRAVKAASTAAVNLASWLAGS
jgi:hypothetical protein